MKKRYFEDKKVHPIILDDSIKVPEWYPQIGVETNSDPERFARNFASSIRTIERWFEMFFELNDWEISWDPVEVYKKGATPKEYFLGGEKVSKVERLAFERGYRAGKEENRRDLDAARGAHSACEEKVRRYYCEKNGHVWKSYFKTRKCRRCDLIEE